MSIQINVRLAIAVVALTLLPAAGRYRLADPQPPNAATPVFASSAPALPSAAAEYGLAAAAVRRGDFVAARRVLAPLAANQGSQGRVAQLLQGLYAHRQGKLETALELLQSAASPFGHLEDWRLVVLAETAHSLGLAEVAEEALAVAVRRFPISPLRAHAMQRAVEIAYEHEQWPTALHWIERARGESLPVDRAREIERIAWEIGEVLERPDVQETAARRLLVHHPVLAFELQADQLFAAGNGDIDWRRLLTASELQERARRLVDNRLPDEALRALEFVGESERDLNWRLLHSEALTGDHRGVAALEFLTELDLEDPAARGAVAWQRALAALDAAQVRRGRANLSQHQRLRMRAVAAENLQRAADSTDDEAFARRALRRLFDLLSDEDDAFDQALAVLQRIQRLDPSDTTGTRYLWRLGWQAYSRRDFPVAVGYWSELRSMYPQTSSARSGWYWTARAHEAMGHEARASDLYREIAAADTPDFYSRHAALRLTEETGGTDRPPDRPTEPWPHDSTLDRASWLSELALDDLALLELGGLRDIAQPRALCAVEAVILARVGRRRESIRALSCAFSSLGRADQSVVPDDALRLYYPLDFREIIERRSREQDLSPFLVFAMIRQESAFDVEARSWAGARGLMQLMPATGRELAQRLGLRYSSSRLEDPDFSVRLGTRYYRQMLDMFQGNQELALAGYNAGPYRIKRLWRQAGNEPELDHFVEGLTLEETKTYVKRILLFENSYLSLYAQRG